MAKILIVDDNYSDCLLVESILKKDEHEIISINDGIYVLDTVKSFCPDIIILDLDQNGYSGIDVCYDIRAIKELDDTIILFLTIANDFESWKKQAKEKITKLKHEELSEKEVYEWIMKNK